MYKDIEIVVAKYRESINWTEGLKNVTIYDKSGEGPGIILPNVGREANTYLYHICNNYENLAEITYFSQGSPTGHVNKLNFSNKLPFDFMPLGRLRPSAPDGNPFHGGLPVGKSYMYFFDTVTHPSYFHFAEGAIFGVTKKAIQQRSLEFYQKLYQFSIDEPLAPWVLERLWAYIFIKESHQPNYILHIFKLYGS